MERHKVKTSILIIMAVIFVVSLVRYLPIIYKGSAPWQDYHSLILGRNYAETGKFSLEDKLNIMVTTAEIKENGQISNFGNSFTAVIYGTIFKTFGFDQDIPVKVSIVLFALSSALIFLLTFRLLGWWPALVAASLDLFLPVTWLGSLLAGFYEWAVLFFALACLIYFWKKETSLLNLFLASIFFGLAFISRNAFLLSIPGFFIYDYLSHKKINRLIVLALPLLCIFLLWITPGWLSPGQNNTYLVDKDTDFGRYGHLFPDPYTYHFDRENFISEATNSTNPGTFDFLIKYNYPVGLKNQLIVYFNSTEFYIVELFRLTNFGGPLIVLFMIIGLLSLWLREKKMAVFFITWFIFWLLAQTYLRTDNWDHFLEIRWPLLILATLGITVIANRIQEVRFSFLRKFGIYLILIFLLLQMLVSSKWMFHEEYSTSQIDKQRALVEIIQDSTINKSDVVAVGGSTLILAGIHYYTDQSVIFFHDQTIEKLIKENNLKQAFDKFNVKHVIGYSPELTAEIKKQTNVAVLK